MVILINWSIMSPGFQKMESAPMCPGGACDFTGQQTGPPQWPQSKKTTRPSLSLGAPSKTGVPLGKTSDLYDLPSGKLT